MTDPTTFQPLPFGPEISVVVPLFNEAENVPELYRRLVTALSTVGVSYRLVFVNDGSRDATPVLLDDLAGRDACVTAIHLSRNFGHQAAITAGLDHATGHAVIVMDGDLQDPPEVLGDFLAAWREGHDVVYAIRTKRKEGPIKRTAYSLFYRLLRATSELDIPLDSGDFCLMDRRVVDTLKQLPERQRFVRGLRAYVGFRQFGVCYERNHRHAGKPKYGIRALTRLAMDGMLGFSRLPLALVIYLGLVVFILALGLTGGVLLDAWRRQAAPSGWAITLIALLFLGSMQMLSLGIVAEYVRRIFLEVKQRPTYLVARVEQARKDARDGVRTPSPREVLSAG